MTTDTRRTTILTLATLLVAAVLVATDVLAGDTAADGAEHKVGGGSPLIIPAAAFATAGYTPDSYIFNTLGYVGGTSSFGCLQAPAYLPHGAIVTRLIASIVDQSSSTNMAVSLVRTNNAGYSSATEMAAVLSNGYTTDPITNVYQDSSIVVPEVSYPEYGYFVQACLPDYNFRLYQVEIDYTDTVLFRDGFESGGLTGWSSQTGGTLVAGALDRSRASDELSAMLENETPDSTPQGTAKSVDYGSPLSIPPSDFKPDGLNTGEVLISFLDGVMYGGNYANSRFMHAPVWLPDGAVVTDIDARVVDDDAGGGGASNCASGTTSEIKLWLNRSKGCSGSTCWDEMASASTSGASPLIQFLSPTTIDYPTVDGSQYGYYLVMRLCGPKHRVYGVRISYTMP